MTTLHEDPTVAAGSAAFKRGMTTVTVALATIALAFGAAGPAYASPLADEDPPGSNGTVKIHEWPDHKNASDSANDPKVCQFEIHGTNFDGGQTGMWWVQDHKWGSGDRSQAVLTGDYAANASGDWTRSHYSLDDGHYKLFVEMTHQAGNSGKAVVTYKHKVFKVECDSVAAAPAQNPVVAPTPTPTQLGSQQPPAGQRVAGQQRGPQAAGPQASTAQASGEVALASQASFGVVSGFEFGIMSGTDEVAFFFVNGDGTMGRAVAGISNLPATSTAPRE